MKIINYLIHKSGVKLSAISIFHETVLWITHAWTKAIERCMNRIMWIYSEGKDIKDLTIANIYLSYQRFLGNIMVGAPFYNALYSITE